MEGGVADDGADGKHIAGRCKSAELGHLVDVNEMSGPSHPERHNRDETLPAGEHAPVFGGDLCQHGSGFRDRSRNVTSERRRLHG
jgi:hypothetical protein